MARAIIQIGWAMIISHWVLFLIQLFHSGLNLLARGFGRYFFDIIEMSNVYQCFRSRRNQLLPVGDDRALKYVIFARCLFSTFWLLMFATGCSGGEILGLRGDDRHVFWKWRLSRIIQWFEVKRQRSQIATTCNIAVWNFIWSVHGIRVPR